MSWVISLRSISFDLGRMDILDGMGRKTYPIPLVSWKPASKGFKIDINQPMIAILDALTRRNIWKSPS